MATRRENLTPRGRRQSKPIGRGRLTERTAEGIRRDALGLLARGSDTRQLMAAGIPQSIITDLQQLAPFSDPSGSIDIPKAIRSGASTTLLERNLGVESVSEAQRYVAAQDEVGERTPLVYLRESEDVEQAQETLRNLRYEPEIVEALVTLREHGEGQSIDPVAALEAGVEPDLLGRVLSPEEVTKAQDTVAARVEVGDRTPIQYLQAVPEGLPTLITAGYDQEVVELIPQVLQYADDQGQLDMVAAVQGGIPQEVLERLTSPEAVTTATTISTALTELGDRTPVEFIRTGGSGTTLVTLGINQRVADALEAVRSHINPEGQINAVAYLQSGGNQETLEALGITGVVIPPPFYPPTLDSTVINALRREPGNAQQNILRGVREGQDLNNTVMLANRRVAEFWREFGFDVQGLRTAYESQLRWFPRAIASSENRIAGLRRDPPVTKSGRPISRENADAAIVSLQQRIYQLQQEQAQVQQQQRDFDQTVAKLRPVIQETINQTLAAIPRIVAGTGGVPGIPDPEVAGPVPVTFEDIPAGPDIPGARAILEQIGIETSPVSNYVIETPEGRIVGTTTAPEAAIAQGFRVRPVTQPEELGSFEPRRWQQVLERRGYKPEVASEIVSGVSDDLGRRGVELSETLRRLEPGSAEWVRTLDAAGISSQQIAELSVEESPRVEVARELGLSSDATVEEINAVITQARLDQQSDLVTYLEDLRDRALESTPEPDTSESDFQNQLVDFLESQRDVALAPTLPANVDAAISELGRQGLVNPDGSVNITSTPSTEQIALISTATGLSEAAIIGDSLVGTPPEGLLPGEFPIGGLAGERLFAGKSLPVSVLGGPGSAAAFNIEGLRKQLEERVGRQRVIQEEGIPLDIEQRQLKVQDDLKFFVRATAQGQLGVAQQSEFELVNRQAQIINEVVDNLRTGDISIDAGQRIIASLPEKPSEQDIQQAESLLTAQIRIASTAPVVGAFTGPIATIRNWSDASPRERALDVGLDALGVVGLGLPAIASIRGLGTLGTVGRLTRASGAILEGELLGPTSLIIAPTKAARYVTRNLFSPAEILISGGRRIPSSAELLRQTGRFQAVADPKYSGVLMAPAPDEVVVKLRIGERLQKDLRSGVISQAEFDRQVSETGATIPQEIKLVTNKVVYDLMNKGVAPPAPIGNSGATIEVRPSIIQEVLGQGAIHMTPDIRSVIAGPLTIDAPSGGGLFFSWSPHTRFADVSAGGLTPVRLNRVTELREQANTILRQRPEFEDFVSQQRSRRLRELEELRPLDLNRPRYRSSVIIEDPDKGILVVRGRGEDVFLLPGGGVDNDSPQFAAIKEISEELGTDVEDLREVGSFLGFGDSSDWRGRHLSHFLFEGKLASKPIPGHEVVEVAYWKPGSNISLSTDTSEILSARSANRPFNRSPILDKVEDKVQLEEYLQKKKLHEAAVAFENWNMADQRLTSEARQAIEELRLPNEAVPGGILLNDSELLAQMRGAERAASGTEKGIILGAPGNVPSIYKGTAELEQVLPNGIVLPKASQILTMVGPDGRTYTIAVIGKPLTLAQRTQLLARAPQATLINLLQSPIKMKFNQADELDAVTERIQELKATGRLEEAAFLERRAELMASNLAEAGNIIRQDNGRELLRTADNLDVDARNFRLEGDELRAIDLEFESNSLREASRAYFSDASEVSQAIRLLRAGEFTRQEVTDDTGRVGGIEDLRDRDVSRTGIGPTPIRGTGLDLVERPSEVTRAEPRPELEGVDRERIPSPEIPPERPTIPAPVITGPRITTPDELRVPPPTIPPPDIRIPPPPGIRIPPPPDFPRPPDSPPPSRIDIPTRRIDIPRIDTPVFPRVRIGTTTARIGVPEEPPTKIKPPFPGLEEEEKPIKVTKGIVAWRQGLVWILVHPPYRQVDLEYVDDPPPGVTIVKGPKSAYKTITRLRGGVPPDIDVDIGAFRAKVTGNASAIQFRPDPKNKRRRYA